MVDEPRISGDLRWVSKGWQEGHIGDGLTILGTQLDCFDYFLDHIPGSVNLLWTSLVVDENEKLLEHVSEIKELAEEDGATKDKLIICSCGTGGEVTNEFTIFKHLLGYPRVKVYEGSWMEWSSRSPNRVAMGLDPR